MHKYLRFLCVCRSHKASKTGSEANHSMINRLASQPIIEDVEFKDVAYRSMELENIDKETIHLLVFLFMQFLSNPEQAVIPENKNSLEYISMQKCFQCLFSLIGFDDKELRFTTMPHKVRATAQFSSFFANLPQVLDNNFSIGNFLISNIVFVLLKSPFPPRYAANLQPTHSILKENLIYQGTAYTLWHLEPTTRKNWLEACLVIVYKYNFSEPETLSDKVLGLIRIIINSLSAHVHVCSKFFKNGGYGLTMRSRELSETSIGPLGTVTLQGTEENSAFNSRTSPTSNPKEDHDEDTSSPSEQKEAELETIFENARSSSNSPDDLPKNISVENPLFYNLLPDDNPDLTDFLPENPDNVLGGSQSGRTMQVMENGKVKYVKKNGWSDSMPATKQLAGKRKGPFFNSPPSPLSLMDVLTNTSTSNVEDRFSLTRAITEEDLDVEEEMCHPPQERLLPIGTQQSRRVPRNKHQNMSLLDRVWQVLGSSDQNEDCVPLVETDLSSKVKIASDDVKPSDEEMMEEENGGIQAKHEENCKNSGTEIIKHTVRQRKLGTFREPVGLEENTEEDEEENYMHDNVWTAGDSRSSYDQSKDYKLTQPLTKQSHLRIGEDTVIDKCSKCGARTEIYSHPELSLCLVVLNTLVHRDPELAAPLLPEIFLVVSR